jgi:F-type H+-transporting ATPase subunit epsilon
MDGDIGVLPGHTPLLGVLVNGAVGIRQEHGEVVEAAVHGGFLSIADDEVMILAESAELARRSTSTVPAAPSRRRAAASKVTRTPSEPPSEHRRASAWRA